MIRAQPQIQTQPGGALCHPGWLCSVQRQFSAIVEDIKKIAEELIKHGFIITKPTSYGLQVSLNRKRVIEIEDFIKKILVFEFD